MPTNPPQPPRINAVRQVHLKMAVEWTREHTAGLSLYVIVLLMVLLRGSAGPVMRGDAVLFQY